MDDFEIEPFEFPSTLPLIVLGDCYHFPGCDLPLRMTEESYVAMLDYALEKDRMFAIGGFSDAGTLFPVVTAGALKSQVQGEEGISEVVLRGVKRMRIVGLNQLKPFPIVRVEPMVSPAVSLEVFEGWQERLAMVLESRVPMGDYSYVRMADWVRRVEDPSTICDVVGAHLMQDHAILRQLLAEENTEQRMEVLLNSL